MGVVFSGLLVVGSIALFKILWLGITLLVVNGNMAIQFIKTTQGILLKTCLMLCGRNITKGDKNGIAGMVMGFVKRLKLVVAKIGNICRLSATVVVVGAGGVEVLAHGLPEC